VKSEGRLSNLLQKRKRLAATMRRMDLGRPTDRKPPFKFSAFTRVGFSDTDAQGIVYYGRYLPYFDLARVEYERHLGLLDLEVGENEFVMRASTVVYEAPARFDDLLEVFVRTKRIGRSSMTNEYCVFRVADDLLMCAAEQTLVLVWQADRCPTPIAAEYRSSVAGFEGTNLELAVPAE
jgi:acyl-CoA thioester hydrolase